MNTIDFYNNKSTQLIERYDNAEMSSLHQLLLKYIPIKSMVLDIGFGSGRDLQFLHDNGYDIWGIDPAKKFVENAKIRFSGNREHFFKEGIPFPKKTLGKTVLFDAVISIAVWMHLHHDQYDEAVDSIVGISKPGAIVVISYSAGEREDNDERYFEGVDLKNLIELFLAKDFKLIKSVINACQKYEYMIQIDDYTAKIPLGIVVEQWIFDYMPFVFKNISQQNSGNVLDNPIVSNYNEIFDVLQLDRSIDWEYAYIQFRKAYEDPAKPLLLSTLFLKLAKKIATKIVNMPMKHIGQSHYELFSPDRLVFGNIHLAANQYYDTNFSIKHFDHFSISRQHYNVFRYLGQTLYGTSTIISKWKEKTKALNDEESSSRDMIDKLSGDVLEVRNTSAIRAILSQEKECVWSGKRLRGNNYDVDHILPFSVWFNNDLWNMLPTNRGVNQQQKKTKIPTPSLIEKRAEVIKHYWNQYITKWPTLFKAQVELSLTGSNIPTGRLADVAIESLCKKSHYLIYDRGHEKFDI